MLLLGGASGTGKTGVAYRLARDLGVGVAAVDDLVAVLQRLSTPEQLPALHFWESHPNPGSLSAGDIQQQGTEIACVMMSALEAVIENHLQEGTPTVVEGDFIHPALAGRSTFGEQPNNGRVRAVFLLEDDVDQLVRNFADRELRLRRRRPGRRSAPSGVPGSHANATSTECQPHRLVPGIHS